VKQAHRPVLLNSTGGLAQL